MTFFLETTSEISTKDFKNLRNLYLPLIGPSATVLFEYLHDMSFNGFKNLFSTKEVINHLQIEYNHLNDALINLEAVGLVNRFVKGSDVNSMILCLNPPLCADKFNKNKLLKTHLVNKIGIMSYEKILYSSKKKTLLKTDYIETTTKYQDVFANEFLNEVDSSFEEDTYSTLDLTIEAFENHDDNVKKLPSTHFVKYLLKRNATFQETQLISGLLLLGFSDASINLLIDYCVKHNDKIVSNYIRTIAQDLKSKGLEDFRDIEIEINAANAAKMSNYKKNNSNIEPWLDMSSPDKKEKKKKLFKSVGVLEFRRKDPIINEVVSDEDLKEMFGE